MEAAFRKSLHGSAVKEEKRNQSSSCANIVRKVGKERNVEDNSKSPHQKDVASDKEIESAKAEMEEVMEENQRLRMHLNRRMKDFQNLQMQFNDIIQIREAEKSSNNINNSQHECEEAELVSLSLGRTSSDTKKELSKIFLRKENAEELEDKRRGLTLGLDCKFETESSPVNQFSPENSLEKVKDEIKGETYSPPHRNLKTMRKEEVDDVSQQNPAKRAKVSIRVRCDSPTMNDGCQWRKYGQKTAKGNPCPRAYYRCTVAPSCPVRKQVQRCFQDMSILIITYEGTHNHQLPLSATSMAFTTSAAASMLLSSSSSTSGSSGPNINPPPRPFFNLPINSSSHPTITLDLTSNYTSSTPLLPHHNSSYNSSTNLNFSRSLLESNWSNNGVSSNGTRRPHQENIFQYLQNNSIISTKPTIQSLLPQDSIAAATKAITSDPNFQSALAVALTSIIGSGGHTNHNIGGFGEEKSGQNLKVTEPFPVLCSFPSTSNQIN